MSFRFLALGLAGMILGTLLAAGLQIGHNVLRYLVQPSWLSPGLAHVLLLVTGIGGALLSAATIGAMLRRVAPDGDRPGVGALLLLALAWAADPYFLAEAGWRAPATQEALMRAISAAAAGAVLLPLLVRLGAGRYIAGLLLAGAIIAHALLSRFALLPALGGDLELAAMTPVHGLLYLRGMLFVLLAGTAALLLRGRAAKRME
ncbi:MAG: hypothetical protein Tsb008_09540 [Rhodothalassiaceae bacterium]